MQSFSFITIKFSVYFQGRHGKGEHQISRERHRVIPTQKNFAVCTWTIREQTPEDRSAQYTSSRKYT